MAKQQRPLTQKQETFVRKVAEGMAASRAYREAGYTATAHAADSLASGLYLLASCSYSSAACS